MTGLWLPNASALMAVAAANGLISAFGGLYISYYLGAPPGATVVLVATALFAVTLAIKKLSIRIGVLH